jgi:hypothetical protein
LAVASGPSTLARDRRDTDDGGMTKPLDVLLIEAHLGDAEIAAHRLEAAGHRVHRCYPSGDDHDLCSAMTDDTCPIEQGVDVALLTRGRITPRPTGTESGATCALRAGVPLVELGSDILDPFERWVTVRVDGDIVGAVEQGADQGFDALRAGIRARTERVLVSAGVDPDSVEATFAFDAPRLTITLHGPAVTPAVQQALGVRVLDALRADPRTYGQVTVTYDPTE